MPRISSVRRIRQMEFFMYTYDIEQLLKNGSAVKLKPQGYSMYPLFLPGRDEAVIEHCVPSELHRGDVILYRRVQGILVLHRICRITRMASIWSGTIRPKWKDLFPRSRFMEN